MSKTSEKRASLIPGGPRKEEELLICRYNKAEYWVICVVCLGLAMVACVGKFYEAERCAYDRYPGKEEYESRKKS